MRQALELLPASRKGSAIFITSQTLDEAHVTKELLAAGDNNGVRRSLPSVYFCNTLAGAVALRARSPTVLVQGKPVPDGALRRPAHTRGPLFSA